MTARRLAVVFIGELHDAGFNAAALAGVERAIARHDADIAIVSGIAYDLDAMRERLAATISTVDAIVFIGGQGNVVVPELAGSHPQKRFAIVQGEKTAANLASYSVRQEESAFLAGVLAAGLTQTGTVAHLSGHRVRPGLLGRAAFVAGVAHANADVSVLTAFCGTQDDSRITEQWAAAEIAAGADVLFTMLNAARSGAIAACRAAGIRQIGNALDWVATDPAVFIASAIARIDLGVERAIDDLCKDVMPDSVVELGLADGDYVSLSLAEDVPPELATQIGHTADAIRSGRLRVPDDYTGPEFNLPEPPCAP